MSKPKTLPKPKVNLEPYRAAASMDDSGALEHTLLPPYTPQSDRLPLFYSPSPSSSPSTLPRLSRRPSGTRLGGATGQVRVSSSSRPQTPQGGPPPLDTPDMTQRGSLTLAAPSRYRPTAGIGAADVDYREWRSSLGTTEGVVVVAKRGSGQWNSSQAYQSPALLGALLTPPLPPRGPSSSATAATTYPSYATYRSPHQSPAHMALRKKRSSSFDMGEIAVATAVSTTAGASSCVNYARRLGALWTRRSQSLHGMLVQCASVTSTSTGSTTSSTGGGSTISGSSTTGAGDLQIRTPRARVILAHGPPGSSTASAAMVSRSGGAVTSQSHHVQHDRRKDNKKEEELEESVV